MAKPKSKSAFLSGREIRLGWVYFAVYLLVLPELLSRLLPNSDGLTVNACYYGINFIAIIFIFRELLGKSLEPMGKAPGRFLVLTAAGFCAILLSDSMMGWLLHQLVPDFSNVNDQAFRELTQGGFLLTLLCSVVLVPPVEECLFRGLIFRGLYSTNRTGAYCLSVLAFCGLHILSYLNAYSGQTLLLCFIQYIPAGLVLAWSFDQTDSIFAPILIHAAVNAVGILTMR